MSKGDYDKYESKNTIELDKDIRINDSIEVPKKDVELDVRNIKNSNLKNIPQDQNEGENIADNSNSQQQPVENVQEIKSSNYETLDESIGDTMKRDLRRIVHKLEYVLLPRFSAAKGKELQNWDLWGPLLFCLILCITIAFSSASKNTEDRGDVFIIIFVVVWFGGFLISLNAQFLGAHIICLLGYCIFPIDLAAVIIRIISSANFVKLIVVSIAFVWSCISSVGFISGIVPADKKWVAVYPVFLFFLVLSWFVLTL